MKYIQNRKLNKGRQKSGGQRCRSADYSLLSYFSDTFLFQYDCRTNMLTFTPNLANRFHSGGKKGFRVLDPREQMDLVHPDDAELLRNILNEAAEKPECQSQSINLRFVDNSGVYCWMCCQIRVLTDVRGIPELIVGKLSDIQEQRLKEQRLIEKASVDSMTGILNRKAADYQIAKRLSTSEKGFLFMIDIDNFKLLNDTLGHAAGDEALIHFVSEIKDSFRQEDLIGRVGGDEFIVFMSNTDQEEAACIKAEHLLLRLANWEKYALSASIGIASYPHDGRNYHELYKAADAAMYQVKQRGKNGYYLLNNKGL